MPGVDWNSKSNRTGLPYAGASALSSAAERKTPRCGGAWEHPFEGNTLIMAHLQEIGKPRKLAKTRWPRLHSHMCNTAQQHVNGVEGGDS